jgi:hypothetical protein
MLSNCVREKVRRKGQHKSLTDGAAVIAAERTVSRMAPLTKFENRAAEPPGNSANTVYLTDDSALRMAQRAQDKPHRTAERTVTSKLAAHGVAYMHRLLQNRQQESSAAYFSDTAERNAGKNPSSDIACRLWAVAATLASTEQKDASTLLTLTHVASQLPATCCVAAV